MDFPEGRRAISVGEDIIRFFMEIRGVKVYRLLRRGGRIEIHESIVVGNHALLL
jgi:hypothetical protein